MEALLDSKWVQLIIGVLLLLAVVSALFGVAALADRVKNVSLRQALTLGVFAGPALLFVTVGLIYPAIRTTIMSFYDRRSQSFVGLENYQWLFTADLAQRGFLNTFWWVIMVPILATSIGLLYAILVDKSRFEKWAKSLLFMPMAISFVGAGIIWKLVYEYKGANFEQLGLANALITAFGGQPVRFLQDSPWNTFFLIVVMIWIQAGFAMVLLSAALKAVPEDIIEAARLDGVNPWQMFANITVPSIRPTLVVVLTTIIIASLKIFDITQTMTGGNFDTQVLANVMYDETFTNGNNGTGSAAAVAIFVLVIPVVAYNIKQMIKNREVRGA